MSKIEKALREIARFRPAEGNILAWRLVLIARAALDGCNATNQPKE